MFSRLSKFSAILPERASLQHFRRIAPTYPPSYPQILWIAQIAAQVENRLLVPASPW